MPVSSGMTITNGQLSTQGFPRHVSLSSGKVNILPEPGAKPVFSKPVENTFQNSKSIVSDDHGENGENSDGHKTPSINSESNGSHKTPSRPNSSKRPASAKQRPSSAIKQNTVDTNLQREEASRTDTAPGAGEEMPRSLPRARTAALPERVDRPLTRDTTR